MMPYRNWTTTVAALFLLSMPVYAEDIRDFDPLFNSIETLEVEVEGPFEMLARERPEDEEADGKFRYSATAGALVEFDVRIRTRGNWRRNPDICEFPPLRINFRKSQADTTLFDNQDKVKLVTHCENLSGAYEQAVFREYLAYRIFNLLTEKSYRVRLLRIKYVYTERDKEIDSHGILIEHDDRLGDRIGGETVQIERTTVEAVNPVDLNIASLFQYFLGNTDFSPIATEPDENCCHNQKLFTSDAGPYQTIPYDFDQSGFVDARHAVPNPRFGIRSVKTRVYRGRCTNNGLLPQTFQLFRERRDDIEALIINQAELTSRNRRELLRYIEDFYDTINSPKHVEKRIIKECI